LLQLTKRIPVKRNMNGDRLHLPTLLCSASICGAILATAGCSNANSAAPSVAIASPSVPDTTAASPTAAATFYGFDDPPGGYTNVFLNADFTVQTVMGGV